MTAAHARRGRIGLIVPSTNAVMERDLWRMAPEGVAVLTARMHYDRSLPPLERLERQIAFAPQAVRDLTSARVGVVVYGCTSGSFFRGLEWERGHHAELTRLAQCPVVLTARAVIDAARALGLRRVTVFTPYAREVNERLIGYLRENGLEVVSLSGPGAPMRPEDVPLDLIESTLRREARLETDGFVVPCTALPVLDAIERLESVLGRPVVTSDQAAMWAALRTIGVHDAIQGFGRLLREALPAAAAVPAPSAAPAA